VEKEHGEVFFFYFIYYYLFITLFLCFLYLRTTNMKFQFQQPRHFQDRSQTVVFDEIKCSVFVAGQKPYFVAKFMNEIAI